MTADVPVWISPVVMVSVFAMVLISEAWRPLRARVEPALRHTARQHDIGIIQWLRDDTGQTR